MKKTSDQELVDKFIDELVEGIVNKYKKDIDFIILYGSAAKGQFIKGASDIDLVVQLKKDEKVEEVLKYSTSLFWKLDNKHGLGFKDYLATGKSKGVLDKVFHQVENKTMLNTPLFILGPNDLDWEKGKAKKKSWSILSSLFVSTGVIFLIFKKEGRLLYGRDIRKQINFNLNFWERWKGVCIPVYFSIIALLILPISPRNAVKYSVKSLLWGLLSALIYLDNFTSEKEGQINKLKKYSTFDLKLYRTLEFIKLHMDIKYHYITEKEFTIIEKALKYKRDGFDEGIIAAYKFVFKAFIFILKINFVAMVRYK